MKPVFFSDDLPIQPRTISVTGLLRGEFNSIEDLIHSFRISILKFDVSLHQFCSIMPIDFSQLRAKIGMRQFAKEHLSAAYASHSKLPLVISHSILTPENRRWIKNDCCYIHWFTALVYAASVELMRAIFDAALDFSKSDN